MNAKKTLLMMILVLALAGFACGQFDVEVLDPNANTNNEAPTNTPAEDGLETPSQEAARDETSSSEYAQYWTEVEDYRTGVRFAIPCFWVADIPLPEQDPSGFGSFSVNNFTSEFVASLGNKQAETVWTIGGMKFDFGYIKFSEYNLTGEANLDDLANAMYINNDDSQITSLTPLALNGQEALRVDSTGVRGDGRFYLLHFDSEMVVMVAPFPLGTDATPDFQAILHSIALTPEIEVQVPDQMPSAPPEGMSASCLGDAAVMPTPSDTGSAADLQGTLDCTQVQEEESQMWVICNVQDSFISQNTQPLWGFMGDVFQLGYWQSEGRSLTRDEALQEIVGNLMPVNTGGLTFTTDRTQFPPLFGMQPEQMFDPAANIVEVVYSEGWGQDGNGAAMLVFSQDQNGNTYFYGMVYSGTHFDK